MNLVKYVCWDLHLLFGLYLEIYKEIFWIMCLKLELKSANNVLKLKKLCFLVYYGFQSIQGFLNNLENMCGSYELTYSTNIQWETFMAINIIHNLQGFHIHYKMYMVVRRLGILLFLFFLFYKISYHIKETKGR
jgi:hypothetical protein